MGVFKVQCAKGEAAEKFEVLSFVDKLRRSIQAVNSRFENSKPSAGVFGLGPEIQPGRSPAAALKG